jgi:tetratricopeptide (TPR) repeat protein
MPRRILGALLAALVVAPTLSPLFAKPPDLPSNPTITVGPLVQAQTSQPGNEYNPPDPDLPLQLGSTKPEAGWVFVSPRFWYVTREMSLRRQVTLVTEELRSLFLWLNADPLMAIYTGDFAEAPKQTQPACSEPQSSCPYVREQTAPIQLLPDSDEIRSVMDNLAALEKSTRAMEEARRLAAEGRYPEALKCLEEVRNLCPGSVCDKRVEESYQEILTAAAGQKNEQPCCNCPFCNWLHQLGMCWMSQLADWCKQCCGESRVDYEIQLEPPGLDRITRTDSEEVLRERIRQECGQRGESEPVCAGGNVEELLQKPVDLNFVEAPLSQVLADLREQYGVPIVSNVDRLDKVPVNFRAEQVPLRVALGLLLKPFHLRAEVKGCIVDIGPAEESSPEGQSCGESVCPKAEAMHAKYAGVAEQVAGLMKACYLAIREKRFEKAADLARQAHALDPRRVEADPLIYKMHLLGEKCLEQAAPRTGPETQQAPPADEPQEFSLRPALPGTPADIVGVLDALLLGRDELSSKDAK